MVIDYKSARPMLTLLTKPKKPRFTISNPSMDLEERMMVTKTYYLPTNMKVNLDVFWPNGF